MTNETKDYSENLRKLYNETYKNEEFTPEEFSLVEVNGETYAVAIERNKDTAWTNLGDNIPHTLAKSTTFCARLDKDGNLTGDSFCIRAEGREEHMYSQRYINRMTHLSNEELLSPQNGYTMISIDKNLASELPRYTLDSQGYMTGNTSADYTTFVEEFHNVTDRAEILKAAVSPNRSRHYTDKKKNKTIAGYCHALISLTEGDATARAAETARIAEKNAERTKQQRIEQIEALKSFVATHPASKNPISQAIRKMKAGRFTKKYEESKRTAERKKNENDLDTKRNINILSNIIHGRYSK